MLIQDFVHKVEQALGSWFFKITLVVLATLLLGVAYDFRDYRNMAAPEAMDAAQLARNIAQGKGYSTLFVRPLSIFLVKNVDGKKPAPAKTGPLRDDARMRGMHPDIANPPLYPVLLAGLMKVLPFHYAATGTNPFWSPGGHFQRYEPDFLIALLNQLLFFAIVVLMFFWARRLFDGAVAWTSVVLLLFSEVLWGFSVSGLSTMLLLLIFSGLVWCLTLLEGEVREPRRGPSAPLAYAGVAGFLVGLGGLTRYAFSWMIIPVIVFLILFGGARRVLACVAAVAVFAAVLSPWVVRNYQVSGEPFGTATYAILENGAFFPRDRLERSLDPDFSHVDTITPFRVKLTANVHEIVDHQLPRLGGIWVTAFFVVGLMIDFQNPTLRRLRYFLLISLAVLIVVQAMGRTRLSDLTPQFNSENLLVLLLPLTVVYGVAIFYVVLDQLNIEVVPLRFAVIVLFCAVAALPMEMTLVSSKVNPLVYPPYYPPQIQQASDYLKTNELMMSDIPWAVAWYGQRQCVWLTLNATQDPEDPHSSENFLAINDFIKPINELYLTPQTLNGRFLTDWVQARQMSWGSFIVDVFLRNEVPPNFPVYQMPPGYKPDAIVLQDYRRWHD